MGAGATGLAPDGELRLEAVSGKASGFSIVVSDRLVIGRQSTGPGRLADDPELSRHHAELTRTPAGFTIEDLSSTNGTFLNGKRLTEASRLSPGDEIELGGTRLVVREAPVAPPLKPEPEIDVRAATVITDVPAAIRSAPKPVPAIPSEPETAVIEPEPEPEPEPAPIAGDARLVLWVNVAPELGEALITPEGGASVHLRLTGGRWQLSDRRAS